LSSSLEIGGTVGLTSNSLPFLEAVRQMRLELGPENSCSSRVTLVPFIPTPENENKTHAAFREGLLLDRNFSPTSCSVGATGWLPTGLEKENRLFCQYAEPARHLHADMDTITASVALAMRASTTKSCGAASTNGER